jgi:hypothetical protein
MGTLACSAITFTCVILCFHFSLRRYGATLTNLIYPDNTGVSRDIVLGFDDAQDYCGYGGAVPNHPCVCGVDGCGATHTFLSFFLWFFIFSVLSVCTWIMDCV